MAKYHVVLKQASDTTITKFAVDAPDATDAANKAKLVYVDCQIIGVLRLPSSHPSNKALEPAELVEG